MIMEEIESIVLIGLLDVSSNAGWILLINYLVAMIPLPGVIGDKVDTLIILFIDVIFSFKKLKYMLGYCLMRAVYKKCKVLGKLECYIIGSMVSTVLYKYHEFDQNLWFGIACIHFLFQVMAASSELGLDTTKSILISITIQVILSVYYYQSIIWAIERYVYIIYWIFISVLGVFGIYLSNLYKCSYMIQRKLFHVLMLLIFVPGLNSIVLVSFGFLMALDVLIILEFVRRDSDALNSFFIRFIDEKDSKDAIVTHLYLLVGIGFPILLSSISLDRTAAVSGLVSLGIGDSFASIVGHYFGQVKLPYRKKTLEGTLACWGSMVIGFYLLGIEIDFIICIKLCLIALYEAYTTHIDNLVLPIFSLGILSLKVS